MATSLTVRLPSVLVTKRGAGPIPVPFASLDLSTGVVTVYEEAPALPDVSGRRIWLEGGDRLAVLDVMQQVAKA